MKKRDRRKRRERRLMRKAAQKDIISNAVISNAAPDEEVTVKIIRDSSGKQYIKAPDGSLRRADKTDEEKLNWLAEA